MHGRPVFHATGGQRIERAEALICRAAMADTNNGRHDMNLKRATVLIGALALTGLAAQPSLAQQRDRDRGSDHWEQLGCQKVGFLVDRDAIKVGRREGKFKAIRLEVSGNTVYINDLKVVYGNGAPDDLQVRSEIREGGQTRPLDLKGRGERAIDRVELTYRAKPNFKGSAKVCVSGLT
jgi:hypothetical protein